MDQVRLVEKVEGRNELERDVFSLEGLETAKLHRFSKI